MQLLKILFLVTLVGIAGCESREEARRKQVSNNLKQIGLALHAYHSQHAEPSGKAKPETRTAFNAEEKERGADKTAKVSGVVAAFHQSPDGEIDGISLKDGTEVRFPSKSGENITSTVSIGDQVEISGWTHAGESEIHAATIKNVRSGKAADVDQPPPEVPE